MALTATLYQLAIQLSHVDRARYETLELRVARHPSESAEYMLTRVLAYCLEYDAGIAFTDGVSAGDEPAVLIRDLTGKVTAWIEVGLPSAERLHRAAKLADRVAVYTHRDVRLLVEQLGGKRIHRAAEIPIVAFDRGFVDAAVAGLERRTSMTVSVMDSHLYLEIGGQSLATPLEPRHLPDA